MTHTNIHSHSVKTELSMFPGSEETNQKLVSDD